MNALNRLKQWTTIVADTSDFNVLAQYQAKEATTNPSLILQASQKEEYQYLIEKALKKNQNLPSSQKIEASCLYLLILFGKEILDIIPGRVSTEVNAYLSFNKKKTISMGEKIIKMYEKEGIERERILIKIPATWEGIQAAMELKKKGIQSNLTLIFSIEQAIACAQYDLALISPFVGRVFDWYKEKTGIHYSSQEDPGVLLVKEIYSYYKQMEIKTEIMGASFRNIGQIQALSGCDLLTISPQLLEEMKSSEMIFPQELNSQNITKTFSKKISINEKEFQKALSNSKMANENLRKGIQKFCIDAKQLENVLKKKISK